MSAFACPSCGDTGYVRYRPAESQSKSDYGEQTCSCRSALARPACEDRKEKEEKVGGSPSVSALPKPDEKGTT